MEEIFIFPQDYAIEKLEELPTSSRRVYYFPGASVIGGYCDCIVSVTPFQREPWIACFEKGQLAHRGKSGLYTTPNSNEFCVVCRGKGYIVQADTPQSVLCIDLEPIYGVLSIVNKRLLLFISLWEICAYGASGFAWCTGRISLEGVSIREIGSDVIHVGIDEGEISIDLETGKVITITD